MKHGPYETVVWQYSDPPRDLPAVPVAWTVIDWRTGKTGHERRTEREAEIDLAQLLLRNMMHG